MLKRFHPYLLGVVFLLITVPLLQAQQPILPLKEVKPGMKGLGKAVFQGSEIEDFGVEIIGVLPNALGPQLDVILARLTDERMKYTGVIAGMSGSPVYIDGKLVGALSTRLGTMSKEPIAGITPIEYMLELSPTILSQTSRQDLLYSWLDRLPQLPALELLLQPATHPSPTFSPPRPDVPLPVGLRRIETPLVMGGFSPEVVRSFQPWLRELGFTTVQGGGSEEGEQDSLFEPGAIIAVQLIRGDMNMTATGTVTYRQKDNILAFGHYLLQFGNIELPMTKGRVLTILPDSLGSAMLTTSTELVGSIVQDRIAGVLGIVGKRPRMIPVEVEIKSDSYKLHSYHYEIISDRTLAPVLLNITLLNTIYAPEKAMGEFTLRLRGKIELGEHPPINITNFFSGTDAPQKLSGTVAAMFYLLYDNQFQPVDVNRISLSIDYQNQRRQATIERAWFDKEEVLPGGQVNLQVVLKPYRESEVVETLPLRLPPSVPEGELEILIGDVATMSQQEKKALGERFLPRNFSHLIRLLKNARTYNTIYVRFTHPRESVLVKGQFLPAIPPSLSQIMKERKSGEDLIPIDYTVLSEERISTDYFIVGEKKLTLKVKR